MANPVQVADAHMPAVRRQLQHLLDVVNAQVVVLLKQLRTSKGELTKDRDSLATLARVRRQVKQAVTDANIDGVRDTLRNEAVLAADEVASQAEARSPQMSGDSRANILRIVNQTLVHVPDLWKAAADSVARTVNAGVVGGVPLNDLLAEVAATLDVTLKQAETLANAAIAAATRGAVVEQAESLNEDVAGTDLELVYLYYGPDDGKNRPFCRRRVGHCYTKALIDEMDNGKGQPMPVFSHCGGYNCRHEWLPVTVKWARSQGLPVHGLPKVQSSRVAA